MPGFFGFTEILVILGSMVIEYETFRQAHRLEDLDRKNAGRVILMCYPLFFQVYLALCSIGYLIFAFIWFFDTLWPIKLAGAVLLLLSAICFLRKKTFRPFWWTRLDSILCLGSLFIIFILRVKTCLI